MNRPPYLPARQVKLPPMVNQRALEIAQAVFAVAFIGVLSLFIGLFVYILIRSPSTADRLNSQQQEREERADAVNKLILEQAKQAERDRTAARNAEIISEWKKLQQLEQLITP